MGFWKSLFSENAEDKARRENKARKKRQEDSEPYFGWGDPDEQDGYEYEDDNPFSDPADVEDEPEAPQAKNPFGDASVEDPFSDAPRKNAQATAKAEIVEKLLRRYVEMNNFRYITTYLDADGKVIRRVFEYDEFHSVATHLASKANQPVETFMNNKRNENVKLPDGTETRALTFEPMVVFNGQYHLLEEFFGSDVTKSLKKAYYDMLEVLRDLRKPQQPQPQPTSSGLDVMKFVTGKPTTAERIAALESLAQNGANLKASNLDAGILLTDAAKEGNAEENAMMSELAKLNVLFS